MATEKREVIKAFAVYNHRDNGNLMTFQLTDTEQRELGADNWEVVDSADAKYKVLAGRAEVLNPQRFEAVNAEQAIELAVADGRVAL